MCYETACMLGQANSTEVQCSDEVSVVHVQTSHTVVRTPTEIDIARKRTISEYFRQILFNEIDYEYVPEATFSPGDGQF